MRFTFVVFITLCLVIAFTFVPTSTFAISKMPDGTKIANTLVENKRDKEIKTLLKTRIAQWKADGQIVVTGDFETISLSKDIFIFDIDATVNELNDKTKR